MSELPEAIRGSRIRVDAYQFFIAKQHTMSISTTAFYGLGRDFSAMIPQGYTAFTAAKGRSYEVLDEAAKADALRKQAQREAWRKRQDRKNEINRAARAKGKPAKSRADLVLRVNPHSPICVQGGEAVQRAAIRKEMAAV